MLGFIAYALCIIVGVICQQFYEIDHRDDFKRHV